MNLLKGTVKALQNPVELHAHLIGQRISSIVVGSDGGTALVFEIVGVILGLEHVHDVSPVGLSCHDHPGILRVRIPLHLELPGGPVHSHSVLDEGVHELRGGGKVGLVRGDDVAPRITVLRLPELREVLRRRAQGEIPGQRSSLGAHEALRSVVLLEDLIQCSHSLRGQRPVIPAPPVDLVLPGLPDVHEELLPGTGGIVQDRTVCRHRVVDGLAEMPFLRFHRHEVVPVRKDPAGNEPDLDGGRVALGLGQEADDVVEVGCGPEASIPPGTERPSLSHGYPGFVLEYEAGLHGHPHLLNR